MLVNITCRLKPINWEKTIAIMDSDLVGIVRNASVSKYIHQTKAYVNIFRFELQLHVELFKNSYTNKFHPFLINITINLCNILETRKGNPYGKLIINLLSHFTNVNHSCPFWVCDARCREIRPSKITQNAKIWSYFAL